MKIIIGFLRIFVGVFFIISGFVKLSDPIGFSYKLSEYFSPDVLNLEFLQEYALPISLFVVIFEVFVGVLLIIGYQVKFTLVSLLGMIVFFTFLTFYSAYYNKVTDCGCFGDALKLSPWETFGKDVMLLIMIGIIILGKHKLFAFFNNGMNIFLSLVTLGICGGYAYYVMNHLPVIDFRAYKIGTDIAEAMSVPEGAPEAVFEYHWKFTENDKTKTITTNGIYPKTTGKFIGVETEQISEGYEPPIHDFSIEKGDKNYLDEVLAKPEVIILVMYNLSKSDLEGMDAIEAFVKKAKAKGKEIIALSASDDRTIKSTIDDYNLDIDFFFCDETALKTIIRSNPGILKLEKGIITDKRHWKDSNKIKP